MEEAGSFVQGSEAEQRTGAAWADRERANAVGPDCGSSTTRDRAAYRAHTEVVDDDWIEAEVWTDG